MVADMVADSTPSRPCVARACSSVIVRPLFHAAAKSFWPTAAFPIGTEEKDWLVESYLLALNFTFILAPMRNAALNTPPHRLGWLLVLGEEAILVVTQLYRYRRVSRPLERQQTKWVIFGFLVPAAVYVGGIVLSVLFPALYDPTSPAGAPYQLALTAVGICLLFSFPLSLGVAMLHYRLWDIDVLINRTLVYGTLTAIIVGAYVLVVSIISTLLHTAY
jgi:hypothetical protein